MWAFEVSYSKNFQIFQITSLVTLSSTAVLHLFYSSLIFFHQDHYYLLSMIVVSTYTFHITLKVLHPSPFYDKDYEIYYTLISIHINIHTY